MNKVTPSAVSRPDSHGPVLAIAAIPVQVWEEPYAPCKALKQGTIFPGLDLPFYLTGGDIHG